MVVPDGIDGNKVTFYWMQRHDSHSRFSHFDSANAEWISLYTICIVCVRSLKSKLDAL